MATSKLLLKKVLQVTRNMSEMLRVESDRNDFMSRVRELEKPRVPSSSSSKSERGET